MSIDSWFDTVIEDLYCFRAWSSQNIGKIWEEKSCKKWQMWAMKGNSTCCFLGKKLSWWPGQIKSRCLTDSLLSLLLREIFFLCTSFPSCSYLWLVEDPNDLRLKLFLSLIASLDNKSSGLVARLFTTDTTTTSSSTFKSIPDNNPFWPTFLTRIYSFF